MKGFGWLADRPKPANEDQDFDFGPFAARALSTAPPLVANLRTLVLSVLDQGSLGSCVANAGFQAIRMRHVAQGVRTPRIASRLAGYFLARSVDHMTAFDAGTYLRTFFQVLNKLGFADEEAWPYDDGPAKFKLMPTADYLRQAIDQRSPTVYRRILTTGNDRLLDVKRAVAGGYPVCFGVDVDEPFAEGSFHWAQPILPPSKSIGGHAMLVMGYDGDVFEILNSWGTDWGHEGRCLFTPEYLMAARDLWIVEHAPVVGER